MNAQNHETKVFKIMKLKVKFKLLFKMYQISLNGHSYYKTLVHVANGPSGYNY